VLWDRSSSTAIANCSRVRPYADASTQIVSASTRSDSQAPSDMNSSATLACLGSSIVMIRTTTFVSTLTIALFHIVADTLSKLFDRLWFRWFGENGPMNVLGRILNAAANNKLIPVFVDVPFDYRSWPYTQPFSNYRRHRYLALRREF